jgi:hypothetical protein
MSCIEGLTQFYALKSKKLILKFVQYLFDRKKYQNLLAH